MEHQDAFQLILLFSGIAFALAGFILFFFPPRKINHWYGYRTAASMRSQNRWDFAQKFSAKTLAFLGFALMAASLLGKLVKLPLVWGVVISLGLIIAGCVVVILKVEKTLKNRFGDS